jgi:hypothetical protein
MKMTVIVTGDHPILARPDKCFGDPELAKEYVGQLIHAGYDNVEVKSINLGPKQNATLLELELSACGSIQDDRDWINNKRNEILTK